MNKKILKIIETDDFKFILSLIKVDGVEHKEISVSSKAKINGNNETVVKFLPHTHKDYKLSDMELLEGYIKTVVK